MNDLFKIAKEIRSQHIVHMISILLLNGVVTTDLVFVVFDNNVLMCVEDMLAVFTIFVRM